MAGFVSLSVRLSCSRIFVRVSLCNRNESLPHAQYQCHFSFQVETVVDETQYATTVDVGTH